MELIYQGFDGLDVTFQGMVPEYIRYQLKVAKEKAQEQRKPVLALLGEKEIPVWVEPTGVPFYQFSLSTGLDRENWFIADNNKSDKWNIRVSAKSLSLATHGYKTVKANILQFLRDIEARGAMEDFGLLERIGRFDYCFDFLSDNFVINPKCISAHSNATRKFMGGQELITKNKDIEYAKIGQLPGRQIVFYDKLKEIIKYRKFYWWNIWGIKPDGFKKKILRIEIRAGKDELNTWNLNTFADFEEMACDVLLHIANSIRYVKPNPRDTNKARWKNYPFWDTLIEALQADLNKFKSNAERGRIIIAAKNQKMAEFQNLILNLIPPYIAIMGRDFDELPDVMAELNEFITQQFNSFPDIYREKIENAAGRYKIYE